jgi:ERCC4-related helicase
LLQAADAVVEETKVRRIVGMVAQRFRGEQVLFFTEYKATQALVMSALQRGFGDRCVTFINGDGFIEGVLDSAGRARTVSVPREAAAEAFNGGTIRFLVSTEAAAEGIDLQERCSTLVHVDLPWNPMRLHQRVGRLSRYGQSKPVEVFTFRNPATVESRIWEKLNGKLESIMQALGSVMDEPEDLLQLVLGMSSPSISPSCSPRHRMLIQGGSRPGSTPRPQRSEESRRSRQSKISSATSSGLTSAQPAGTSLARIWAT